MSVHQNSPNSRLTPRKGREDSNVQFALQTVIGSTVSSPNDFATAPDAGIFAYCAGSAVVLATLDASSGIQQHFYRAKPDALPLHASPSYYKTVPSTRASEGRAHAASPVKDEPTINSPNRSKINQRSKSTSCVSLSPSGKYLAFGEIGHHPRILFFSTAYTTSSELLLGCLTDHTFGIRALAFSQDSRWLCSLGDLHDGGLFLWSINPKSGALKLYASNRCTTAETVVWMGSNAVVSIGTRHVKVWRLEEPSHSKQPLDLDSIWDGSLPNSSPQIFSGRNCLLGPLMDAVFTCVTTISDEKAIVCTQDGAICLLDDVDRSQRLTQVARVDFNVRCIAVDHYSGVVWLGPHDGEPKALSLSIFTGSNNICSPNAIDNVVCQSFVPEVNGRQKTMNLAIGMIGSTLIRVDASHTISIFEVNNGADEVELGTAITHLPAHDNAALGAIALSRPNEQDSDFLTYSVNGDVLFWLWNGTFQNRFKIPLNRLSLPSGDAPNEIKILDVAQDCNVLVAGDKDGVLHLFSLTLEVGGVEKAHDGDINDIALCQTHHDSVIIASCGRDRTIQIVRWSKGEVSIEQTLVNEHVGSISKVAFANRGTSLISMSSDRTLIVRRKVPRNDYSFAFISTRVITLKTTPIAMSVYPDDTEKLIVSTVDRCVRTIEVTSGHTISTFKVADSVNSDAVVLVCVSIGSRSAIGRNKTLVAGASSTDRSLRIYDGEAGTLLAKDQGQAAVSSIMLAQRESGDGVTRHMLVSTGSDGSVMIWTLNTSQEDTALKGHSAHISDFNYPKSRSVTQFRPLRRVLSKSEIKRLQRDVDNRDPATPTGKGGTSYATKKTSMNNLSAASDIHSTNASTAGRRTLQPQLAPQSPSVTLQSKMIPPLPDEQPSLHDVSNPANLKLMAERACACLRTLRQQISSSDDILKPGTAEMLQRELQTTLNIIGHPSPLSRLGSEASDGEQFTDYLSRLIDERLALQLQPEGSLGAVERHRLPKSVDGELPEPEINVAPSAMDMAIPESKDGNIR